MANKVDVFTEELSKVFTILQQQYVMIKYMKALITSGELDETEINKLKEQITLINTNIYNIENALARHTAEINDNTATINALNKVMPTDINADIAGHLILEHDGQIITGQKKQVAVYTKAQVDALISDAGLQTFDLNYPYTGMYPTDNHAERGITNENEIPMVYKCIRYVQEHGACILKIRNGKYTSTGYTDYNPVYVLCITSPDSDNSILECYGTTGEHIIKLISDNDTSLGSESNTKIIYDKIAKASDSKNVFRHTMSLTTELNIYQFEYISSNNLVVNSLRDLTTLLKPKADQSYFGFIVDSEHSTDVGKIVYNGSIWQIAASEDILNVSSVSDIVTTI